MNSEHSLRNVEELYEDSRTLYTKVIMGEDSSADTLIANLAVAIRVLETNWKGIDAGVNIQKVAEVHNELVSVRNALAKLACDSSKVAVDYRRIQFANGAPVSELSPIVISDKSTINVEADTADTININPAADGGRLLIFKTVNQFDNFVSAARDVKDKILVNWLVGPGRNDADDAFNKFEANVKKYKDNLNLVSSVITSSLRNYSF